MKMRCLYKSVLRGDIVKAGQVLDLTAAELQLDVVKRFFVAAEEAAPGAIPGAAPSSAGQIVVAGLTREEAILKLQDAGQRVGERISDKRLAERFEETFGAN